MQDVSVIWHIVMGLEGSLGKLLVSENSKSCLRCGRCVLMRSDQKSTTMGTYICIPSRSEDLNHNSLVISYD